MAKEPIGDVNEGVELRPNGWAQFERAVDAAVKSGPKHRARGAGIMIVYDVATLPTGERVISKPYKRLPDGTAAAIIAS
jgi:hypothetical protein